jgi:hypothetical protein
MTEQACGNAQKPAMTYAEQDKCGWPIVQRSKATARKFKIS